MAIAVDAAKSPPFPEVGCLVQVYSKTFVEWIKGTITNAKDGKVLAEFTAPDGKLKEKWMPSDHKELRPFPGSQVPQAIVASTVVASTTAASPMSPNSRSLQHEHGDAIK